MIVLTGGCRGLLEPLLIGDVAHLRQAALSRGMLKMMAIYQRRFHGYPAGVILCR